MVLILYMALCFNAAGFLVNIFVGQLIISLVNLIGIVACAYLIDKEC